MSAAVWAGVGAGLLVVASAAFAIAEAILVLDRTSERREQALSAVLLVETITAAGSAGIVGMLAYRSLGVGPASAVLAVFAAGAYLLAQVLPKTWALRNPDRAAHLTAPLVKAVLVVWPLRWNAPKPGDLPAMSEQELLALAGVAEEAEAIESEERELITSVIEFGDTIVREVMVPRTDMITVNGEFRVADAMEVVLLNGYSRIPVVGEGIDDVIGVLYAKDLMRAERDGREDEAVRGFGREARFVPETKRVAELLREMQGQQFHMAVVIDEYGGTAGLVTLEDLIEELVGEIVDEFDVEDPMIEPLPGGVLRVNGRLAIDEANEVLTAGAARRGAGNGADGDLVEGLPEGDWDTVGGLLFSELGHVAAEGDTVQVGAWKLRADKVQGRRISRVRITKVPEEA